MSFSSWHFLLPGVILPLAVVILAFCCAAALSRQFRKAKSGAAHVAAPFLVWGLACLIYLLTFSDGLTYPVSVSLQPHAEKWETIGEVSSICNAPVPPLYYQFSTKTFLPAKLVTVNNSTYYLIEGEVSVGQHVQFIWSTNERIVQSWNVLTPQEAARIGIGERPYFIASKPFIGEDFSAVGRMISIVSMFIFALLVVVQFVGGRAISHYLEEKDKTHTSIVIPNRFGLLTYIIILLPLAGIIIGWGLTGFDGVWFIGILALFPMLKIILTKQTTSISIEEDNLYYEYWGHGRLLPLDDISSVRWCASRIPHNRCIMIEFKNGFSILLEQENFWGLDHLYDEISRYKKHSSLGK